MAGCRFCDIHWHNNGSAQAWQLPRMGISEVIPGWGDVNRLHHWLCRSARWRKTVRQRVPWALSTAVLGDRMLEIGPGPGLTTDLLRRQANSLTAIEIDPGLAESLKARLHGSNVRIVVGDAAEMPFPDEQFSSVVSFTMLHHLSSTALQDQLFAQVWRVLEPGGVFVGSDSRQSWQMRMIHIGDTLVPIDPETVSARLELAGFEVLEIEKNSRAFRFHARRPARGSEVSARLRSSTDQIFETLN